MFRLLNPQNAHPMKDSTQANYVNLKPPQNSFDLFCLLQRGRGLRYYPTSPKRQICDIFSTKLHFSGKQERAGQSDGKMMESYNEKQG